MSHATATLRDAPAQPGASELEAAYRAIRSHTEILAGRLLPEDQCVQSMDDASPAKWHRAHTTWFFEQFVLEAFQPGYRPFDGRFGFLFNSYYESVGARHPRPSRGLLTRPTADEVSAYRQAVDATLLAFIPEAPVEARTLIALGLQHEQQHQELLLTDILHVFAQSPLAPAAIPGWREPLGEAGPECYIDCPGGIAKIGHRASPSSGFAFDNETPCHQALLTPYRISSRLVRNSAYAAFIEDRGYSTPTLWMADGWARLQAEAWAAPLYWRRESPDAAWMQMGPGGLQKLEMDAPVRHVSWYEADAFARWSGARLPTEAEFEAATGRIGETTGHVWQWTSSAYAPYPGFKPVAGAVGEYNGKFMINQMVLRGGSLATPPGHARPTYRNFFHPDKRWQFSGIRLAKD